MSPGDNHSLHEAGMYNVLCDYYKYTNPELHVYYYHKHLQSLQHAFKQDAKSIVTTDTQRQTEYGKIRILHGSLNTSIVDIYINGIRIFKEISPKKMSNDFTLIKGRYQIDIYETGKMVNSLCSQKITVEPNVYQTFIFSEHKNHLKIDPYTENPVVPPNETKLRFIHHAQNKPVIDIAVKKGDIVFPKLKWKTASNYLGLFPMTVLLEVRDSETKEVITELPPLSLEANKGYSAFLLDSGNSETPFDLVLLPTQ